MPAPVDPLTPLRFCITGISKATGSCTFEASPLLQINEIATSTVHKLFICLKVKLYNFLHKQGIIWPFNIIRNNVPKSRADYSRQAGVEPNHV
jgi:hypothetical protein